MLDMTIPIFLCLLWSLVEVHSQTPTAPYLTFNGRVIPNHAYVDLSLMMYPGDDDTTADISSTVICHTDLTTCCRAQVGSDLGNWSFPNGDPLPGAGLNNGNRVPMAERRRDQLVRLQRGPNGTISGIPSGIYRCAIETMAVNSADNTARETVYVGVYGSGGDITITGDMTFTVVSDLNGASPRFILTCISTGGPATTVTWTRDSDTVMGDEMSEFITSPAATTAQYTHTLIVTERLGGEYTCNVSNDKPSSRTASFTVQVAFAPDNPMADVQDNLTSVKLTWSPPTQGHTIGYRINYGNGGSSGSVNVSDGSTDNYLLTGLQNGTTYNITIMGLSQHFFSSSSAFVSVTLTANTDDNREGGGGDEGGGNAGAVVAGILVPLILLALIVTAVIIGIWWWRRRSKDTSSFTEAPVSHSHQAVQYQKPPPQSAQYRPAVAPRSRNADKAPVIVRFPRDTRVQEGEGVLFQVEVTGAPQPELTWYHNGEEVVSDYSKELAEDGSLTMPSAETKHSGVYQLVALNPAGRVEREVKLVVDSENEVVSSSTPKPSLSQARVPVSQLANHVEKNHSGNNRGFKDEYQGLYDSEDKSTSIATNSENRLKNRFANICVYDDHRVLLKPLPGHADSQGDYINASYVDGYSTPNKFLSTQGPLPKTLVDFWRLVWQERPPSIVMITNVEEGGKIKCQQYWPETGSRSFGPFQITISDEQMLADYTIRKLNVQLTGNSERALKVTQFHFTAWPDHGVPDYATPILAFHRRVVKEHKPRKGPMMVHCSAGVGRTGTFITIDHVLEQAKRENVVDIPGTVNRIRQQRMKLVQTVEQYTFIHDAMLESVTCGDTQIVASDLRVMMRKLKGQTQTGGSGYKQQFSILEKVSPNPLEIKSVAAQTNTKKNRSMEFLPVDRWRVVLRGESPDYINATVVHGYKQQRAFIIAQSPMQSTARDFWKMISDRKCGVIVMLCDLVEAGKEVCYQYWPRGGSQTYGEFTVELLGEEKQTGFVARTFSVTNTKTGEAHQVSQFHITNWAPDGSCANLKTVTDVIEDVVKVQIRTGNQPILMHCSDTVSRSGMFCAIATTIERCKTEGVVDVFQVVKALRVQKPGAVRTVEQYQIVFEAVLVFLDSFDTYANFES